MRQIVLDTETTGLDPAEGHRIIEIGCVELINRKLTGNHYHQYLNPEREVDPGAVEVHGITNEMLADKPHFADVAAEFMAYIEGAQLIIHNAPFDVGFIDHELRRLGNAESAVAEYCTVLDTLALARRLHPGQKNTLDALCKRYAVDNSQRALHGALLDAEILADVYLAMTGGQASLSLEVSPAETAGLVQATFIRRVSADREPLRVILPTDAELRAHEARLDAVGAASSGGCVWHKLRDQ